jgi:hypothetical protein
MILRPKLIATDQKKDDEAKPYGSPHYRSPSRWCVMTVSAEVRPSSSAFAAGPACCSTNSFDIENKSDRGLLSLDEDQLKVG